MHSNWGIYVHVPWCRRRCPYCDFYFEVGKPEASFGSQVTGEFLERRTLWPETPASTLYFGGGTPSVLPASQLSTFISGLDLEANAEITLEANPEDVQRSVVTDWKLAGINRVSLGVQSFDDAILRQLGRKHRADDAWEAIKACLEAGISRISVDFIFGVPSENRQTIYESIAKLSELGVGQVSAYLLTVEPGTNLEKHIKSGRSQAMDDDDQAQAYEDLQTEMLKSGYRQYEVSSYAKEGQESRHNRNYWGKGQYLGLGPSAHSMRFLAGGSIERSKNKASLHQWKGDLATFAPRECEFLGKEEALLESIAFGLRDLVAGVSLEGLARKHHSEVPKEVLRILERSVVKGWVEHRGENFHLTSLGVRFSDGIARDILACG
jgi:oxygen-independent coproporphyrinogen-3 oxidase